MSDLVGNPEDRFSQNEAQIMIDCQTMNFNDVPVTALCSLIKGGRKLSSHAVKGNCKLAGIAEHNDWCQPMTVQLYIARKRVEITKHS